MRASISDNDCKKYHWLFFLALFTFYLSFTPGTIKGMGYNLENLNAADQVTANLISLFSHRPLAPVTWPRHGLLEVLFELPFVLVSRLIFGDSLDWAGRVTALQPILATALSCVALFLWVRQLTRNLAWSYWLGLTAGVATMLWPYSSIGLETTQSLFLMLSAYLALAPKRRRTWASLICFSLACATTISVKLNGIFLTPAIVYLLYCYFFEGSKSWVDTARAEAPKIGLVLLTIACVFALNRHYSSKYWASANGGSTAYFFDLLTDSPVRVAFQFLSYFGSVNKSLLLYAPVTALALYTLPRAYRIQPRVVVFTGLCLAGMAGGHSLTFMWADETWGPRYLHESILPLMVCFASSKVGAGGNEPDTGGGGKAAHGHEGAEFRWRKEIPLLAAAALGVVISFLGSFFYYGNLHVAAMKVSQPALELLQHDPRMNHIEFNARLLKVWARGRVGRADNPDLWPSHFNWWFQKPPDGPHEKTVDLRELAIPLPLMAKGWEPTYSIPSNEYRAIRLLLVCSLLFSLTGFAYLAVLSRR
jgi:hypothetical protein